MYKISFIKVYKVIFQNKDDKKLFTNLGIVDNKKVILSPGSGVDLNYFSFKKIFLQKTKFLFFGRLLNEKGIREFINVAIKINKLKLNCEFKIVGNFDKKTHPLFQKMN